MNEEDKKEGEEKVKDKEECETKGEKECDKISVSSVRKSANRAYDEELKRLNALEAKMTATPAPTTAPPTVASTTSPPIHQNRQNRRVHQKQDSSSDMDVVRTFRSRASEDDSPDKEGIFAFTSSSKVLARASFLLMFM